MKINIGITEKNRNSVVGLLNILLSDEYVLYTKTLNYHWNITGNNFAELHKFLEEQYQALQEIADSVAERIPRSNTRWPFLRYIGMNFKEFTS